VIFLKKKKKKEKNKINFGKIFKKMKTNQEK